jgi:hypothetical protein
MEDIDCNFQLTSAKVDDSAAATAGWCVRCPKHRKKFCGGLYFSVATGYAYVKGVQFRNLERQRPALLFSPGSSHNPKDHPKNLTVPGEWVRRLSILRR